MYIVAIGWLYVSLMMALTEPGLVAGILSFTLYGLAPLALFFWLFGRPARRRRASAEVAVDQEMRQPDRADAERDQ